VEHLAERMEEGFIRSDARMDRLAERMESGFARMDARLDEGFARADARTDNVSTRMEEGFARMDTRLDALMTAITSTRIYPDTLSARLDRLEREVQELRKA
jgi:outer membrane murein-binding lipoprotein Lpp